MATLKDRYADWIPIRNGWDVDCPECEMPIPLGATALWKEGQPVRCVRCVGGKALAFYARGISLAWFRYHWAKTLGFYDPKTTD